jgi:GT2 family glycosyltransferase
MQKKVGVILVNYKDYAERFMDDCWMSLARQNYPRDCFVVIIVDNNSSRKSLEVLSRYKGAVTVARHDGNYAAANNAGISKAIEFGCEYFVIVNMDTELDTSWLTELVKAVESDPKVGIAQSKILLHRDTSAFKYFSKDECQKPEAKCLDQSMAVPLTKWGVAVVESQERINSIGNHLHYLGFGYTNGYGDPDRDIKGYPEIDGYASGCSLIVKKEVIDKVGGYNEEYYMYHDDIELGWKTKLAGYRVVLAPRSILYHKYEFSRSIQMLYYMERNRYMAVFTFYKWPTIILILPALLAMEMGMIIFSIIGKWFKLKMKANGYFFRPSTWKKIRQTRKEICNLRVIKDRKMIKNFTGKVLFQEIENPLLKYVGNPIIDWYWKGIKRLVRW